MDIVYYTCIVCATIGFLLFITTLIYEKAICKAKPIPEGHLSCPFCGGYKLKTIHNIKYFVVCEDCGCCGRAGDTRDEALRFWDWRQE